MAGSAVVGILRVLLSANTAEYDAAMAKAATSAKGLTKDFNAIGQQLTNVGSMLTKALTLPLLGIGVASAKAAIDFESSFAGIRKTVDGVVDSSGELTAAGKQIQQAMRDLAKEIPVSVNELNKLGESAGELGIPKEKVVEFTKVMAQLGVTTNLTAQDAASAIARIQNIFGAAGVDTDRFASTLVALGNAGASTEKEIVEMAQRIAGSGHTIGLTEAQVLAFASTLASVGINAEAGGSAISRVFLKINDAVAKGGSKLDEFARVAGMSSAAFKQAFETDAAGATNAFITGLGRLKASGENVNATIEGLTGKNIILKDTLLRVSGAGDLLSKNLALSNKAWQDNTALTKEAEQRFKTTEAQLTVLWNRIQDVGITLGNALKPAIDAAIRGIEVLLPVVDTLAKAFAAMPGGVQLTVLAIAGIAAAIGPVLLVMGALSRAAADVTVLFTKKGVATRLLSGELVTLEGAAGKTGVALGLLGRAASIAGAAFIGWQIGRLIADLAGLDQKIADSVTGIANLTHARELMAQGKQGAAEADVSARLLDLERQRTQAIQAHNLAGAALLAQQIEALKNDQTRLAIQDSINLAIKHGASATITYADAVKYNEEWLKKQIAAQQGATDGITKTGDAADKAAPHVSALAHLTAQYAEDLKKIGASGFQEIQAAHAKFGVSVKDLATQYGVAQSSIDRFISGQKSAAKETTEATGYIDRFNKSADTLEKELSAAAEAGVPMSIVLKEFGGQIEDVTNKAPIFGKAIGDATKEASDALKVLKNNAFVDELAADWAKVQADITKGTEKVFDHWMDEEKKVRDASIAGLVQQVAANEKFQSRVNEIGMSGLQLQLKHIDDARTADIRALGLRTDANARWYDQNRRLIDEFYAHEQRLALGTADTIVERMNRQGVQTRTQLDQTAAAAKRDYEQMKASGLFTWDEIAAAAKRAEEAQKKATGVDLRASFAGLAATLGEIGQASDSAFGRLAKWLSETITLSQKAGDAGKAFGAAISKIGGSFSSEGTDWSQLAAGIADAVSSGLAAGIALWQATDPSHKSTSQTVIGGAMAGAAIGDSTSIPGGGLVGMGVGALVGWWRGAHAEWKKVAKDIGRDIGVDISTGLSQQIADLEKSLDNIDVGKDSTISKRLMDAKKAKRELAEALSVSSIIQESGGLNAGNLEGFAGKVAPLFEAIKVGGKNGALAVTALSGVIDQFAAQADKTGGMWSPVFKGMIANAQSLGVQIDGVTAAIDKQISKLSGGLASAIAGSTAPSASAFNALLSGLPKAEADALSAGFKKAQESGFGGSLADFFSQQAKLYQTAPEGDPRLRTWFSGDTLDKFKKMGEEAQPAFDRLSRIALASFNSIIAGGKSAAEAMAMIGPAIDALIVQHDQLGLSGGAAFDQLSRFRTLTKGNEALIGSVAGLNDTLTALSNLGGLNIEVLADLEAQGLDTFAKLQGAGFTERESLQQMVPFIENVIKAHRDLGIPIDENTQKMIDQARAQGLLSDEAMSTNDILLAGFAALIKAVGGELPEAFKAMAKSAQTEAGKVTDAINKIPSKKTVTIVYDEEGRPTTDSTGSGDTSQGPPPEFKGQGYGGDPEGKYRFARGGPVPSRGIGEAMGQLLTFPSARGEDNIPILAQAREGMLNRLAMSRVTPQDLTRLNTGVEPSDVFSNGANMSIQQQAPQTFVTEVHHHHEWHAIDENSVRQFVRRSDFKKELAEQVRTDGDVRSAVKRVVA